MSRIITLLLVFICLSKNLLYTQTVFISPGNDTAICTNQIISLTANFPPSIIPDIEMGANQGYNISSIPFSQSATNGTNVPLPDEAPSTALPIGFNFNFFGTTYSQFYISPNGWIGFDPPISAYFTADLSVMDEDICSGNYPYTGIMGVFNDFNPSNNGNYIRFNTIGIAPNRKLIVSYTNIPFFTSSCNASATFQIHLHETTNIIEVHIANKSICTQWSNMFRTGLCAPIPNPCPSPQLNCSLYGYSGPDIALSDTAWRYTPILTGVGEEAIFNSLQWTMNGNSAGIYPSSTDTTIIGWMPSTTAPPRKYVLTVDYVLPCSGRYTFKDTITLRPKTFNPTFTFSTPVCFYDTAFFTFTGSPNPTPSAQITWNFDGGFASPGTGIGPQTVIYNETGLKNVSLSISSAVCALGTYETTLQVDPCGPVGAESINDHSNFNVFPNPSNGNFNININQQGSYNLKIYNSVGQLITQSTLGLGTTTIDLQSKNVSAGLYFVEISNEQQQRLKVETVLVAVD